MRSFLASVSDGGSKCKKYYNSRIHTHIYLGYSDAGSFVFCHDFALPRQILHIGEKLLGEPDALLYYTGSS